MRGKTCMEHTFQKLLTGKICPFNLEESFKPINEMLLDNHNKVEEEDKKEKDSGGWSNI